MIDERTLNLINADVDGELTADEKEELDRTLESSAEARTMRNELLKLDHLLGSVPPQSPPPGLTAKILDQLRPPEAASRFSIRALFESFQPVPMGMAFVAGLLLTAGFYEMSAGRTTPGNAASMVGTMVTGKSGGLNLLENNLYFSSDDFSGNVSLVENDGLYVLNFDLDSRDRKLINVGLDRTGLSFGGFAETPGNSDNVIDSVTIAGGTLRVASQGRQKFAVFLRETGRGQKVAAERITIDFSGVERQAPASDSGS